MRLRQNYVLGTRLIFTGAGVRGVVVPNYKLPGDICVEWANGAKGSYDADFLDEHCTVDQPGHKIDKL